MTSGRCIICVSVILLFILDAVVALDPLYNVTTYAGGGSNTGNSGKATEALLSSPLGLAVNSKGEVFVSESVTGRIRKVDIYGNISTVAGTGVSGASNGTGGLATLARLNTPIGVAVSENGEVFIAEYSGHIVRKVLTNGTIVAFAGTHEVSGYSGDGGLAIDSKLFQPFSVAVNSKTGDVFISDSSNYRIRIVFGTNGTISTFAGNGGYTYIGDGQAAISSAISRPYFLSMRASSDDLFMTLRLDNRVCKVSNGIFLNIAGNGTLGYSGDGGLATSARLGYPYGAAVGPYGEFYIGDNNNYVIRKVSTNGTVTTIAGTGTFGFSGSSGLATNVQFPNVYGIAVDSNGVVFVSDVSNHLVRKLVPYCTEGILVNGQCESFSCFGKMYNNETVCSGHGSCVGNNNCSCESGWKGDSECSTISCEGLNNCNGHGICSGLNTCSCYSGYFGRECQYYSCFGGGLPNYDGRPLSFSEQLCVKINKRLF